MRASPFYLCSYCCCTGIWLLLIIMIAVSFEYVHYNEMAFGKNSITNKVDTSDVYPTGRHMVGPTISMVRFPRQYQNEAFTGSDALSIFNEEGMDISVEVSFQYRIKEDQLMSLMTTYGTNYETKLRSVAESTLKNTATFYTINDYLNERNMIAEVFNKNVTSALSDLYIYLESSKLQVGRIILPNTQMNKFMDDAIQRQVNQKNTFQQQAKKIRDQTDREVATIQANATFIENEAAARADRIVQVAQAEADRILANAYGNGWIDAMTGLGIEEQADQAEFLRLVGILDNPSSPQLIDSNLEVIINAGR